jgi:hypothetical protein
VAGDKSYLRLPRDDLNLCRDAEEGDPNAQRALGETYAMSGNIVEAVKWWHRAAEQGCIDAQISLGCAYSNGEGIPKDYIQAYMWFDLACWSFGYDSNQLFNPPLEYHRSEIEKLITPSQMAQARMLAVEFAKNYMTLDEIIDALGDT